MNRWKVTTKNEDYIFLEPKNSTLEGGEKWQKKWGLYFFGTEIKKISTFEVGDS